MLETIESLLKIEFPEMEFSRLENCTPSGFLITSNNLHATCAFLHTHESTYFDHLSSLTALDNGPEENTMEVIFTLYSIPKDIHLTLRVSLSRSNPEIDTVSDIWRGANWHEREAFDLYGIRFRNHPDLRRLLLPADWIGYPMRKDYNEEATYHGMTIKHKDQLNNKDQPNN